MAGLTKYEKAILGLTVGFVIVTGAWFWSQNHVHGGYQVTTMERREDTEQADRSAESVVQADRSAERVEQTDRSAERVEQTRPDSLLPGEKINLNTADSYDLQRLPGIGEKRAEDIIAYREEHGPFQTVDELDEVSGIGSGILEGLREYATVD